jgi:hypothetical protein
MSTASGVNADNKAKKGIKKELKSMFSWQSNLSH